MQWMLVWSAGGAVAWIWGAISWGVLRWHHATFVAFADEQEAARWVIANCPGSGVYGLPAPPRHERGAGAGVRLAAERAASERMTSGPIVTAVVNRNGFGSVPAAMARAYVIYAIGAGVIAWLLQQTGGLTYWERTAFVTGVGLAAGLICRLPDWNWHGYSTSYTAVCVADHVVGAFLLGLALAALASTP